MEKETNKFTRAHNEYFLYLKTGNRSAPGWESTRRLYWGELDAEIVKANLPQQFKDILRLFYKGMLGL